LAYVTFIYNHFVIIIVIIARSTETLFLLNYSALLCFSSERGNVMNEVMFLMYTVLGSIVSAFWIVGKELI